MIPLPSDTCLLCIRKETIVSKYMCICLSEYTAPFHWFNQCFGVMSINAATHFSHLVHVIYSGVSGQCSRTIVKPKPKYTVVIKYNDDLIFICFYLTSARFISSSWLLREQIRCWSRAPWNVACCRSGYFKHVWNKDIRQS